MTDEKLLTAREVADRLMVTERTLHSWRKAGYGPEAITLRRQIRYAAVDVADWLEAQKQKGPKRPRTKLTTRRRNQ